MKVKYIKEHNNYDFVLGEVYAASKYKEMEDFNISHFFYIKYKLN